MRILLFLLSGVLTVSCFNHDHFDTIKFDVNDKVLLRAIDSLYIVHPDYRVPEKWIIYDSYSTYQKQTGNWNERRFYFGPPDEEMYSVFIFPVDDYECALMIEAMHDHTNWHIQDDLSPREIARIQDRFNQEIIPKIDYLVNPKDIN